MTKNAKTTVIILNIIVMLLEIAGTTLGMIKNGVLGDLVYFTVLSNIMAFITGGMLVAVLIRGIKTPKLIQILRYGTINCLTLTFLVVIFVLFPMTLPYGNSAMLFTGANLFHHLFCPIISFVSFVFFEDNSLLTPKDAFAAASPSLIYGVILASLNAALLIEGPYPFLLVHRQPWYMSVLWFLILNGVSYGTARLLLLLVKKLNKNIKITAKG